MRTTNKIFKEQVQEHIVNHLCEDYTTDIREQLQNTVSEFKNWYSPYEQKRTPNLQNAFIEFLKCLPSCLSIEWTYHNIGITLKAWYENCDMEYKTQPHEKESYLYYALIYREFKTLCKKYDVTFY